MRRVQQPLHLFVPGIGRLIAQERLYFGDRRWKTDQIEREATEQNHLVRFGRWLVSFLFQSCQDKVVDRRAHPVLVFHRGNLRADRRLECPMLPRVLGVRRVFRPVGSLVNPRAQETNLFGGQRIAFLRHAGQIRFQSGDRLDEQALGAFAGNKRRTRFAAPGCGRLLVEPQVVFLLLRAVTLVAIVGEDGLNVFDEINFPIDGRRQFARSELGGFGCRHEETGRGEQKSGGPSRAYEESQTGLHKVNSNARSVPASLVRMLTIRAIQAVQQLSLWSAGLRPAAGSTPRRRSDRAGSCWFATRAAARRAALVCPAGGWSIGMKGSRRG